MTSLFSPLDRYDYRAIFLFIACMIYALLGSPTPDHMGWVEFFIGGFLALSIGAGRVRDALLQLSKRRFWKSAGQVFLIYGLSVPLLVAVVSGHDLSAILRDMIPFLFLFLPLFLLPLLRARPHYFRVTFFVILLIGLLFALRSLVIRFAEGCSLWCTDELLYLENMPTVLLSALFLIGAALRFIAKGVTFKSIAIFAGLMVLSLLPIAAMIVTLQRASLGAVVLYIFLIQGYFLYKAPARGLRVLCVGGLALLVINISFLSVFASLWDKTAQVGLNMRPQEFEAVWSVVSADPLRALFGTGWGGQFYSPAVGGLRVNFTHNFFSSMLLKTGLVGVLCGTAYIAGLLERLSRVILKDPVLGLALAAPILIDLTLYASFKSFDFGLLLLMISGALVYSRQAEFIKVNNVYP